MEQVKHIRILLKFEPSVSASRLSAISLNSMILLEKMKKIFEALEIEKDKNPMNAVLPHWIQKVLLGNHYIGKYVV